MNRISKLVVTATCVAATTLLMTACGGGDAEPPPNAAGNTGNPPAGPDTVAPALNIFSDLSGAKATGPVTFTFVFTEDVGASFTSSDITVTGGTPGTLTKVSAQQYTLVVTPPVGSSGTLEVTVGAASFSDLAGNGNTQAPASVKVPFDTVVKTQMALPVSFDSPSVGYGLIGFAGAEDSTLAPDPTNPANTVAKVVRAAGAESYAGTTISAAAGLGFTPKIPFNANDTQISVRVWSPDAGITVRLKVEDHTDPTKSVETDATVTTAAGWQTLTFNFAPGKQASGTAAINFASTYDKATLFFDFGRNKGSAVQKTYYFDDITFVPGGGSTPSSGAPTQAAPTPPARASADVLSIFSDAYTSIAGLDLNPNWGQSTEPSTVAIAGNNTRKYAKLNYQGIDFAGNPIDVTGFSKLHLDYWTADVSSVKVSIISAGQENAVTLTPTPSSWNSTDIDLAQYTAPNKAAIIQVKIEGSPSGGTLYFDNLYFWKSGNSGGSSSPVVFSSGFGGGNATLLAGAFGGYSGSSVDSFNCGAPASCGSGGSFAPSTTAADSSYYYYYQTPSPVTSLYAGIYVQAPGLSTGLSATADTPGLSIAGKTAMKFKFGQNPEWFNSPTNNFGVILTLGKFYDLDPGSAVQACNIKLLAVVSPSSATTSSYTVPLSAFAVIQNCGVNGLTPASALALSPLSQVDFQAVGSGNPLPAVGGKLVGANMSVGVGSPAVYPTTLAVQGPITFE
ncbi:Ig-like domain-containing protein [Roseateles sp. BYS180W]|uniref:Ig-like domain-containing protein n=1 Tax=Roseateles rivi TaxID=3299028 RepID=A0ABW7FSV1_9BURK